MKFVIGAALLAGMSAPAFAQAAEEPALCTDRPTKANSVCTVPTGKIQLETDLVNWSRTRAGGVRTDVVAYTNPYLKFGLGADTDIEANIAPYVEIRTKVGATTSTIGGVGDLTLRLKQRLTDPAAKFQLGLVPFVKVPTAKRGIGNREFEGGLAVPVQLSLPGSMTLTFGPEADLLLDGDGSGRHVQLIGIVNLGKPVTPRLTLYGEVFTAQNYDPAGTVRQYSLDAAAAYALTARVQLDLGGNFGLNRNTPDTQLYVGISTRF
ncbi:MAG: transporter [Pseudomonadota bacterium]